MEAEQHALAWAPEDPDRFQIAARNIAREAVARGVRVPAGGMAEDGKLVVRVKQRRQTP